MSWWAWTIWGICTGFSVCAVVVTWWSLWKRRG